MYMYSFALIFLGCGFVDSYFTGHFSYRVIRCHDEMGMMDSRPISEAGLVVSTLFQWLSDIHSIDDV